MKLTTQLTRLRQQITTDDVVSARVGNGAGVIWSNEDAHICYIRINGIQSQLTRAINTTGCVSHDQWVDVRRIQHAYAPMIVLGPSERSQFSVSPTTSTVGPHGRTHEQPGYPGPDPTDIYPTAIAPLRAQPTNPFSLYVDVQPGTLYIDRLVNFAGERVGPFVQPGTGQRTDLLYLNAVGATNILQGSAIGAEGALWPAGPDALTGTKPIAWILVKASTATINWSQIKPLHFLSVGVGMAALTGTAEHEEQIGWFGYPLFHVFNEAPVGPCNGTNLIFIVSNMIEPGTLRVIRNGVEQMSGLDFEEHGSRWGFSMVSAPFQTDTIKVHYATEYIIR